MPKKEMTKEEIVEARQVCRDLHHAEEHIDNIRGALLRKDWRAADTHAAFAHGIIKQARKREAEKVRDGEELKKENKNAEAKKQ